MHAIAATAANKGYLTSAAEMMDREYKAPKYHFDASIYANRVFDSKGVADPSVEIQFGPNIKDWPAMSALPENLVLKVVSEIQQSDFTIYYSDGFEIITSWFPGFILRNNISLSLLARNAFESGVSATQVREFIMTDDPRLKEVVPASVYENRESIKQLINLSKLNR